MANNIKFGDIDIEIPSFEFKKIGSLIAVIVVAIILFFSVYTVGANENAVVLRFGKYSHTTSLKNFLILTTILEWTQRHCSMQ